MLSKASKQSKTQTHYLLRMETGGPTNTTIISTISTTRCRRRAPSTRHFRLHEVEGEHVVPAQRHTATVEVGQGDLGRAEACVAACPPVLLGLGWG